MKNFFIILLVAVAALTASAQERDDACVFEKFEYLATVHADNSWSVHETIVANFLEERHGIYQYIELPYTVNFGEEKRNLTTEVTNINVLDDAFNVYNEEGGRYRVIRIGDADRTISGSHEYNIDYTLQFFDDGYTGADMLYISVLGAQWKNDVREFSFIIKFDNPFPTGFADSLQVYSGRLGGTANDLGVTWEVDTLNNCIVGQASGISHHNAITLKAALPEGYWDMTNVGPAPDTIEQVDSYVGYQADSDGEMDYPTKVLIVLTFLSFLAALVYLYIHRRRKPVVSVEYNAPAGLSSAEVGYVIDNTVDESDLSSLIVWWASRGYLIIEEEPCEDKENLQQESQESTTIVLTVKKPLPDDAPDFQRKFWNVFFVKSDTCRLKDLGDKHQKIDEVKKSLEDSFAGDRQLMQTDKTALWLIVIFFALAIFVITLLNHGNDFLYIFGCSLFLYFFIGGLWRIFMEYFSTAYFYKSNSKGLSDSFVATLLFVLCGGAPFIISFILDDLCPGILVGGFVLVFFSHHTRQNTPYRVEMLSHILGLKEFIRSAEMPMLKAMVDENPSYFYDVLPYAMAFDLSNKWCKQFEDISIETPDWYVCNVVTDLNSASSFMTAQSLTNIYYLIKYYIRSISINSSTSSDGGHSGGGGGHSGGGGGHSGGGGGGGGGGSW